MRILLPSCLLLLSAAVPAANASTQNSDPVGGWYKPSWEYLEPFDPKSVQIIPDCSGDGQADILLAHALGFRNQAVLDGTSGKVWYKLAADAPYPSYLKAADANGDGLSDIFVSLPYTSSQGLLANGRIELIAGGSASQLWQVDGKSDYGRLGERTFVLDLDGDQLADRSGPRKRSQLSSQF